MLAQIYKKENWKMTLQVVQELTAADALGLIYVRNLVDQWDQWSSAESGCFWLLSGLYYCRTDTSFSVTIISFCMFGVLGLYIDYFFYCLGNRCCQNRGIKDLEIYGLNCRLRKYCHGFVIGGRISFKIEFINPSGFITWWQVKTLKFNCRYFIFCKF